MFYAVAAYVYMNQASGLNPACLFLQLPFPAYIGIPILSFTTADYIYVLLPEIIIGGRPRLMLKLKGTDLIQTKGDRSI